MECMDVSFCGRCEAVAPLGVALGFDLGLGIALFSGDASDRCVVVPSATAILDLEAYTRMESVPTAPARWRERTSRRSSLSLKDASLELRRGADLRFR